MRYGFIKELSGLVAPGGLLTDRSDLVCYSYDASGLEFLPDAVILPSSTEEVRKVMALAQREGIAVFPRGAGSGTTGAFLPRGGGVVLCLARMNRILSISHSDLMAEVEPGVVTGELQNRAAAAGLFYPPDPSSLDFCTIGGNVATGAGGAKAVKYGVTRDYVIGLDVVLPGGDVIRTGFRTAKGVVGYDLTRLMVGSEGTLGVVTGVTLKLIPAPQTVGTALSFFKDASAAASAVSRLFVLGVLPRCAEFMDAACLGCIADELPVGVPETASAMLLVEVDGQEDSIAAGLDAIICAFREEGAVGVYVAKDKDEAAAFWKARRSLSTSVRRLGPPHKISEDICVPRHALSGIIRVIEETVKETGLKILSFGHAGDGNLHVNILLDKRKEHEMTSAQSAVKKIFKKTIEFGGTISGEHGVGLTKRDYIGMELDGKTLDIMRSIKAVFDPKGILNPGKIFPEGD